ncbi:MAG TPA: carboxymuconolactone decarboxylase family protein [Solirubrobacteraceae bacterium]|jgi:alkylhydroperoxidase family enzyme
MTARIAPIDPPYEPEIAGELERLMGAATDVEPLRLFRTVAHHPRMLTAFRRIGGAVLSKGTLPAIERETVIHRVTARAGAEYEWGVHAVVFAKPLGLDEEWLAATVDGAPEDFEDERQRVLIAMCDELHETATLSDATYAELEARWPREQIVELLCLAGFYRLVSYLVNGLAIEPEAWAASFPRRPATSGRS